MSEAQYIQFGQRLQRIGRHHRELAKGYVTSMNQDGLVIARPHKKSSGFPLRGLFLALVAVMLVKGFLLAHMGAAGYADKITLLESGSAVEKFSAYVLRPDPVTRKVATVMESFF